MLPSGWYCALGENLLLRVPSSLSRSSREYLLRPREQRRQTRTATTSPQPQSNASASARLSGMRTAGREAPASAGMGGRDRRTDSWTVAEAKLDWLSGSVATHL